MIEFNPEILDAYDEGYEDSLLKKRETLIKAYKESKSLEEFVKLVLNEFDIHEEDLKRE